MQSIRYGLSFPFLSVSLLFFFSPYERINQHGDDFTQLIYSKYILVILMMVVIIILMVLVIIEKKRWVPRKNGNLYNAYLNSMCEKNQIWYVHEQNQQNMKKKLLKRSRIYTTLLIWPWISLFSLSLSLSRF